MQEGKFREDLYHRLKVVSVRLPKLADRTPDIPLLAEHFIRQMAEKHEKTIRGVSIGARRKLLSYSWPGNVRELKNVVESMVVEDYDGVLDTNDWPMDLPGGHLMLPHDQQGTLANMVGKPMSEMEALFIAETLQATGGNREEAAKMLGIGERTLYRKIKDYNL